LRCGLNCRLIADDQILFLESLKIVIETVTADMTVVGTAHNGVEVVEVVNGQKPDVVLMDVKMPVMNGVEATKLIHKDHPAMCIIMLTNFNEDQFVKEAIKFGAAGYLLKDMEPSKLVSSVRAVLNGVRLVSPSVVNGAKHERKPAWLLELNHREIEILRLISRGTLFLGEQTVKNYISTIYIKMNVKSRYKAIRLAIEANLDQ
jgi:DNA-binding NarL/FixJ family response regulator